VSGRVLKPGRYHLLKKNNLKFREIPGSIKYIEGGYDIDAVFDGDPEAYWNIAKNFKYFQHTIVYTSGTVAIQSRL
jgi:hypothetical protein